ncbi:MAG: hypothetical protein M3N46_09555 [Actinomycetota bacterium]|nr:hypothetical protein [Actinomycetota bacterium]
MPSADDRVLSARLGMAAVDVAVNRAQARMVALRGAEIVSVNSADATSAPKLPSAPGAEAALLFG